MHTSFSSAYHVNGLSNFWTNVARIPLDKRRRFKCLSLYYHMLKKILKYLDTSFTKHIWKLRWLARAMCKNISNLQHTPSKYFKFATHPFKIFQMCNTPLQNISNLQHTPSKYFKFATHPFKIFQICNTPRETFKCATHCEKLSNVQHTATNFQMCNTLRETFKRAAHCGKLSKMQHTAKTFQIRVSCTERP